MLILYRLIINVVCFFAPIILKIRIYKQKEDENRYKEKLCIIKKKKPQGKLVWFHAASVGELLSILPLLEKLEKNNIKTIIFVTPHSKFYLNSYPENQAKAFQEILSKISEKNRIEIYSLYEKYAEVNVWHDHTHLAVNINTNFYPEDVASFIIKELEK